MYIEDVFLNYIVPYISFVGADFLFMQDNICQHVVRWMFKFLEEV